MATASTYPTSSLEHFHPTLRHWFSQAFEKPTPAQERAWPPIALGANTLLLAPTGSGKTLAAFLVAIDRIMFGELPESQQERVRLLYISPLKALGVDVERNLKSPLAGVRAAAEREGIEFHLPSVGVRSGDTPANERHRLTREPPDILITTPESLYLMLTSRAREILKTVDTVIIDEIHSLVGNKRGTHLFVSLERLEGLRRAADDRRAALQRIGLSATQRPLNEIACLLGGAEATANQDDQPRSRPVTIVEAGRRKQLELKIEVPVEDMTRLADAQPQSGNAAAGHSVPSIWPSIHPRLLELIRQHRSTMIFLNSRRLAERMATALNELADEEIALAHHGSIAKDTRLKIEDRLKRGQLPAIVATSSLELGIDMGAVNLVIQIESPPSIASGIQRIGRAGHQVGVPSRGVVIPKFRGDLLACSAAAERMVKGEVEETFYPRNPLDVLAQQIVAMVALEPATVDDIYATIRRAAPFFDLPKASFEGVLDLLSGRYPSHEFSELRPRVNWDRLSGKVSPRKGTQRLAILNAGTIPDRGLYGVFLTDSSGRGSRVGELDEEMVYETHPGDVFLLGASSWRVLDITQDRVIVAPAPGEPGKMPFWHGDGPGRPLEFGRAIGKLTRQLLNMTRQNATNHLTTNSALDQRAARNLLDYLHDQAEATKDAPSDKTILVESFLDEVGDWRVCILSPFGGRVHAPWATAVAGKLRSETCGDVDMMWTDDGIVFRLPEADEPPPLDQFLPRSDEVEDEVIRQIGSTALFAARFRENAARALLLPRRQPGKRTPLWLQRRRSADLLSVASRYASFPILLETYRECLRDVFDITGLKNILQDIERRAIRVKRIETHTASPFASSLMFNYVGKFIYDGDAPLAERRAATLALDHAQLRELLGEAELRELLDADAIDELSLQLQRLDGRWPIKDPDGVHDLLLKLGDLRHEELSARCESSSSPLEARANEELAEWLDQLTDSRRILALRIAGENRFIAAEDAARYRDAIGIAPPRGLPDAFLESIDDPLADLVGRYARTHIPFRVDDVAQRFGIGVAPVQGALKRLVARDRVVEGEFLPGGRGREWCDVEVLRTLKGRSLAKLRKQVEPVEQHALSRFLPAWQGIDRPRKGLDGLLDVVEQLQGLPLPASDLEQYILPARVTRYEPSDLDELCVAGEVVWRGCESIGSNDGRIVLFLTDQFPQLATPISETEGEAAPAIRELLVQNGALFFDDIVRQLSGFRNDVLETLWQMVWCGEVTNDTLAPLRSLRRQGERSGPRSRRAGGRFRSRRTTKLPGSEGRWTLAFRPSLEIASTTVRQTALAAQLIERYGIVTRELVISEGIAGGFSGLYPVFKAMEEAGRIRRGYFVAGLGAAQFAAPGAEDRLREYRDSTGRNETPPLILATTDPANPYGAALRWPERPNEDVGRPGRVAGSRVIIHDGRLLAYVGRTGQSLTTFLPTDEPERNLAIHVLAKALADLATTETAVFLATIDGSPPATSPLAAIMKEFDFVVTSRGLLHRRLRVGD